MLLRLAYLGITNEFGLLRLPPRADRDKDTEILVLRHQLTVLHRLSDRCADDHTVRQLGQQATLSTGQPCVDVWVKPTAACWGTRSFQPSLDFSLAG
jgi:hypothetical protein